MTTPYRIIFFLLSILGYASITNAFATPDASSQTTKPLTILVTPSRVQESSEASLAAHTVITAEQIQQKQAESVSELLEDVISIDSVNQGGAGKQTSFFLRGTESDHVLILIDGLRVGSATSGTTALQDLPVEQIERIEIVRGPGSSLYGSEAIGGVIQIFTKKGGGQQTKTASFGMGSYDSINSHVGFSGGGEHAWYAVNASSVQTDGFNACTGRSEPFAGCGTEEPDLDGYDRQSGSVRVGQRFYSQTEVEFYSLYTQSDVDFDGSFQNRAENKQWVAGSALKTPIYAFWDLQLNLGTSVDESDSFLNEASANQFKTQRDNISIQNKFKLNPDQTLILGTDYYKDRVDNDAGFAKTSKENTGTFAQYRIQMNRFSMNVAAREDDDQQFGNHTTHSIATGYQVTDTSKLTLSYGTAFRAPSFNDLYYPGFSNADLAPEESSSYELQVHTHAWDIRWSGAVFVTKIDQLIALDESFRPQNINKARIEGVELETHMNLGNWDIQSHFSVIDARNRAPGADFDKRLNRRAREQFGLQAWRQFNGRRLGARVNVEGDRFDDLANTRKLPGFGTVDLYWYRTINKHLDLKLKIENALDKSYEKTTFYNQAGRGIYVTFAFKD